MKVGILGSGDVARSLGTGFASKGHEVTLGTRNPNKSELKKWLKENDGKASVGTFAEAAARGELLVLAAKGDAVEAVLDAVGPRAFDGKIVIDATNPLDFSNGMPPGLFVGTTDSLGERVQRKLPRSKVVKCFNIVNHGMMTNPKTRAGLPDMLICGNDKAAKRQVAKILKEFGWAEPIDVGGIDGARWLEAWVPLWVRIANELGSWQVALKILRA
jgi:predicted dinucleotide-binding enzyme